MQQNYLVCVGYDKMKPVLISENKPMGIISLGIFFLLFSAIIWYLEKYLSLFSLLSVKLKLINPPVYSEYILIGVSALFLAVITHSVLKYLQLKKLKLIIFSVNLAVDGSYHYVQAPAAMSSEKFLKIFFKNLMAGANKDKYRVALKQYLPELEIRRSDTLVRFKGAETLANGGLKNGDICQVIGKPKSVT